MHAWLIERVIDVSYDKWTAGREIERSLENGCSILDVIRPTARNDTVVFLARDKVAGLHVMEKVREELAAEVVIA
jgi:hypothetical protein